ncbi:uncharacterized protein LOC134215708 [Armigeres subalbatus]|uniref:uncharacterized protein LOC134215708 n=1 Tax=Armigeres subalbatus TaxID=124917 RepID=UPI002ED6BA11
MNCSCSSSPCPHVQYVRKLLETTDKEDHATPPSSMQKTFPQIKKVAGYIAATVKEIFLIWIAITKILLKLWLNILDSNSYLWLAFLVFAIGLICSLPGVRGAAISMPSSSTPPEDVLFTPDSQRDDAIALNTCSTELIAIR